MAYTAFTNTIFQNWSANTLCNKLVQAVIDFSGGNAHQTKFLLTGCVADYFQFPNTNMTANTISFVTSDAAIYAYFVANVANIINVRGAIAYKDRIAIISQEGYNVEIWYRDISLSVTEYSGVYLQTGTQISVALMANCQNGTFTGDEVPMPWGTGVFSPGGTALYEEGSKIFPGSLSFQYVQGASVPLAKSVSTGFRNYAVLADFNRYKDFKAVISVADANGKGLQTDFLSAKINASTTYILAGNPTKVQTVVSLVDLDLVDAGEYNATVLWDIVGTNNITNIEEVVDTLSIPVNLTVLGDTQSSVSPRSLVFEHVLGEAMPPGKSLQFINSGNFTLSGARFYTFLGRELQDTSSRTLSKVTGSGSATIDVLLSRSVEALGVGFHSATINFFGADRISITVIIKIAASREIQVSPAAMSFRATKGVEESPVQELSVTSPIAYTIEVPDWINTYEENGELFIGPVNTDSFSPGTYSGFITLTSDEGMVRVPVIYIIDPNGFTELLQGEINFTADTKKVNYATKRTGTYVKCAYSGTYYSVDGEGTNFNHTTDVPLFQGNGHFFPGVLLGSLLFSVRDILMFLTSLSQENIGKPFPYYTSASVNMLLEERSLADDTVRETVFLENYLFQKGMTPVAFDQSIGATGTESPLRVTPNSFAMFNFYRDPGIHTMEVHKNGQLLQRIEHLANDSSGYGMLLNFSAHKEGDMIQVKLRTAENGWYVRQYMVFPEGKESYHIAWVTNNEQIELMEFTGALSIGSEYSPIENRVYKDLVDITEVLDIRKAQRVKANTGWILKDNFAMVDSIARSRRAWLVIDGAYVPIVVQTSKLSNFNSESALYAYELDFKINPEHDNKVYSR